MCQEAVKPDIVVHACSPSTLDVGGHELENSLGYRENSSSGRLIAKKVKFFKKLKKFFKKLLYMGRKKELTRAGISSVVEHSMHAWGLKFDPQCTRKKHWKKTAKNQRNLKYFWGYSGIKVWLALSLDENGSCEGIRIFLPHRFKMKEIYRCFSYNYYMNNALLKCSFLVCDFSLVLFSCFFKWR